MHVPIENVPTEKGTCSAYRERAYREENMHMGQSVLLCIVRHGKTTNDVQHCYLEVIHKPRSGFSLLCSVFSYIVFIRITILI